MHIGVEATRLEREVRGIGRYVRALLPRIAALRADVRFTLFVKHAREVPAVAARIAGDPALAGRAHVRPVREMRNADTDVFWYPWNVVRPTPRRGAVVATVHDVAPVALPDPRWFAWRRNWRWRRLYAATASRATLLIADSEFTANEVRRLLGVPRARIRVVPLAADDFVARFDRDGNGRGNGDGNRGGDDSAGTHRSGAPPVPARAPYLLAVGADDRRKNLPLLARAMGRLHASGERATLVLAGPRRHGTRAWAAMPWVRAAGFVSDDELASLYRGAAALVVPSSYEGFGLPVLEAMGLGTPVVCSRVASLPEVAGDAAAYVDAGDEDGLVRVLGRILADADFRDELSAAGRARAERFTWDRTARSTLAVLEEAAELD